ncbi:hypothetical protein Sa4125_00240 [Aureimonas sp. SA4125]|uniref:hypothetical protein n=1 Tax=Aureimonas sp. SA4125 TaxID=2826993 RepID=UPI001CC5A61C|nr:hypothetical protein [Aureimonas sp. SA4125]BDA82482.1 hypothetical protein Sa4125_00240 [Aureimonas sp. SA4125]
MAHDNGQVVTIGCNLCRTSHHYLPADLRTLLGDIDIDTIPRRSTCEACGRRDYLRIRVWSPVLPEERAGLVVRRLQWVVTIRRPIWREEGWE